MTHSQIADHLERFVRTHFAVAVGDPGFSRSALLFEAGYVDSVGVVELLAFIKREFDVDIPDEALFPETFGTIDNIARVVAELAEETSRHDAKVSAAPNAALTQLSRPPEVTNETFV